MSETYSYPDTLSRIKSVQFDILSNREKERISVLGDGVGIEYPELYENSEPKKGGLIDPRLGTSSNEFNCATCGFNAVNCTGHFGHIKLKKHVPRIECLQYIQKILQCVCLRCSKLLVHKNEAELTDLVKTRPGKERMAYIREATKNITYCHHPNYGCGAPIPKIKIETKKTSSRINIYAEIERGTEIESKNKLKQSLTPDIIYDIFKNISDDDCRILGFKSERSRPEDLILTVFPVPPVQVRPSARGEFLGGAQLEDDLTKKMADVVKANIRIIKSEENSNNNIIRYDNEHAHLLVYHVSTFIDNDSLNLPKAEQKGKAINSLVTRLKGKSGRVRGNLMGKRCNFTARTVITGDPSIEINELHCPMMIAQNLTFPEAVTPQNIESLAKLVKNGRYVYPGANFVFKKIGERYSQIDLRLRKEGIELEIGDIVERHLQTGDFVLLNRQPSLHKHSIMAVKLKVSTIPDMMTFKINLSVTTSFGADFDGDEMNIFVPQSYQTKTEIEQIANVERLIITPTVSKPIVGIVQDALLGSYIMTEPNMKIDWREAMNILSYTSVAHMVDKMNKNEKINGRDIFSMIIPPSINYNKYDVKIKNGQMSQGRMSKSTLGTKKSNSLLQIIWDSLGAKKTSTFLSDVQRLINNFNSVNGFSIGCADIKLPQELYDEIDNVFNTKILQIENLITENENNPELMTPEVFEFKLFSELDSIRYRISELIMSKLPATNAFNIMTSSGSKGDATNIAQILGCAGLQAVQGQLVPKIYNNRTSPYFFQNDDRAQSRGFVRNSFTQGIEYADFVFNLMASRIGLIDQTVKSVSYDTRIQITDNNKLKTVQIGEWIDELLEKYKSNIAYYPEDRNLELLEITSIINNVCILTADNEGYKSWGRITAITRHDPGNYVYEIHTKHGRKVKVAESESLLIWNNEKNIFEKKHTLLVKIGNYVPAIPNNKYDNYNDNKFVNDVILDEIINIIRLDTTNYPKLYDITVPSTLNFAIENGLVVRDTSETGYLQRKFVKAMEDTMVKYDGSVRNASNAIIQLIYGDSGADTTKQYEYNINLIEMNNEEVRDKFIFDDKELDKYPDFTKKDNENLYNTLIGCRDVIRTSIQNALLSYITLTTQFFIPVNLIRILDTYKDNEKYKSKDKLTPSYILNRINELMTNTCTTILAMPKSSLKNQDSFKIKDEMVHKTILKVAILNALNPKRVLHQLNLNKLQFDEIMDEIIYTFKRNIVQPGEMVGVVAAQSTGEPLTQLTISSFHSAGIASMAATTNGLPRIKELMSVSKKPKMPQTKIYLTEDIRMNKNMAHKIASHLKYTIMNDIRSDITVMYDPNPTEDNSIMKKDNVKHTFYHHKGSSKTGCMGNISGLPWLMRIELIREKLLEKEITLLDIKSKFCSWWDKRQLDFKNMKREERRVLNKITQLAVLSNSDNDDQPVIHIRFNAKDTDKDKFDLNTIDTFIDYIIDPFKLKGIPDIEQIVDIKSERLVHFDKKTGDVKNDSHYVIYTTGVNLIDIRYIIGIDLNRTATSHIVEIYKTFGIEIARSVLLREVFLAYDRAGSNVNIQHIEMIVDQMTYTGSINSLDRHGMGKSDKAPLAKASFEKVVEQLISASIYGEDDDMESVSSRIMAGLAIKGGTGYCSFEFDSEAVERSEYIEELDFGKKFSEISKGTIADDIINKKDKEIDIFMPM